MTFAPIRSRGHDAGQASDSVRSVRRHRTGFWLIAFAFATAMAFSTVPTPLYSIYQTRDGFSTFAVTVVFAAYAIGVLTSLLLAGHVSDSVGRKRVLIAALALELGSAVLFLTVLSFPGLVVARVISGLGVGLMTATATAHLQELHAAHRPGASTERFAIVSTAANIGGIGLGSLVSGVLAQFVASPLRVPYLVFVALLLVAVAAVTLTPETVEARFARPAYRPQRLGTGQQGLASYLAAVGGGFASFAVLGLFTSVAPGFVAGTLHHHSHALAGLVTFAVFGASALAQMLTGRLTARVRTFAGLVVPAIGIAVVTISLDAPSFALFLIGGIAAGAGAGVLFKSSIGAVAAASLPAKRGEALAGLFLVSYLGLALPIVGIGVATRYLATTTVMAWFAVAFVALLAVVGVLTTRPHTADIRTERTKS
ncbi:MAG TPA: MFS transporter [Jatrophihabitans sp.]|nr:MFS transporter [Jatrophihabitans sp.]